MPKAVILPAGRPASCEPITATRDLGDCLVANQRFADMQRLEVERAGFTVVPKAELDPDTCVINGHAFVTAEDLLAMLKADELQLDDPADRANLAPPLADNSILWISVPAGISDKGIQFPIFISLFLPETILSPLLIPLGAII